MEHSNASVLQRSSISLEQNGFLGAKEFKMSITEGSETINILKATGEHQTFFWRRGCYTVYEQISTDGSCSNNIIDNNTNSYNKNINNPLIREEWEGKQVESNSPSIPSSPSNIEINTSTNHHSWSPCSRSKTRSRTNDNFDRSEINYFDLQIDESDQSNQSDSNNHNPSNNIWENIGSIQSSGCLFDRTIITNKQSKCKSVVYFHCTSRTGDLMRLQVTLPKIHKESKKDLIQTISDSSKLPIDCSSVIVECLGSLYWSEDLGKVTPSQCEKILSRTDVIQLHNKRPTWNPVIQAYTLEFAGRAQIPSVHNFQLSTEDGEVILQLGKVDNTQYNMDYGFPLSAFQAFCICLSVMERSFVWD